MAADSSKIKQYLLGNLPDGEVAEMDMQVIENDHFEAEISRAESELIEEYLEGVLTDDEDRLFLANFLTTPERRCELSEIALIKDLALGRGQFAPRVESTRDDSLNSIRAYLRPLLIGAAALAAVLIALCIWHLYFRLSPLEAEYAELNTADLSSSISIKDYAQIDLVTGSFRNTNTATRRNLNTLTETCLFRLALPSGSPIGAGYRATIVRGGTTVFLVNDASGYQNANGRELRLLLPRAALVPGQYQIKLENRAGQDAGTYAFIIE